MWSKISKDLQLAGEEKQKSVSTTLLPYFHTYYPLPFLIQEVGGSRGGLRLPSPEATFSVSLMGEPTLYLRLCLDSNKIWKWVTGAGGSVCILSLPSLFAVIQVADQNSRLSKFRPLDHKNPLFTCSMNGIFSSTPNCVLCTYKMHVHRVHRGIFIPSQTTPEPGHTH